MSCWIFHGPARPHSKPHHRAEGGLAWLREALKPSSVSDNIRHDFTCVTVFPSVCAWLLTIESRVCSVRESRVPLAVGGVLFVSSLHCTRHSGACGTKASSSVFMCSRSWTSITGPIRSAGTVTHGSGNLRRAGGVAGVLPHAPRNRRTLCHYYDFDGARVSSELSAGFVPDPKAANCPSPI